MFRLRFLSAMLSVVLIMSASLEASALFTSRDPREADLGVLNQQQLNRKEADIAFLDTKLMINGVSILNSGSSSENEINLVLHLDNNSFVEISKGQDVGGWIINKPEGVAASVAEDVERGSQELSLNIRGVSEGADDLIVLGIPNTVLSKKSDKIVKSQDNANASWQMLSPSYVPDELSDKVEVKKEKKVRRESEVTDTELLSIKQELVSVMQGGSAAYREIVIENGGYISDDGLEEIYDYALDAGKSELQLANVCLLFVETDADERTDTRMYVPFKNLVNSGNGINPAVIKDEDNEKIKEVSQLFSSKMGKEGQVILVENKESFGSSVGIVTKLSGDADSLKKKTLYTYDEESGTFSKFKGNYEVDPASFLHVFSESGGYFILA